MCTLRLFFHERGSQLLQNYGRKCPYYKNDSYFRLLYNPYHNRIYMYQRTQNIKEGAYLDYFKYFSNNALETVRKLQQRFQDEFTDDIFYNKQHMFKLIKKLLGAYEVLILEINDSCQFVQIPNFGVCIVKIFFQLMSIIKFIVKNQQNKGNLEKFEREKRPNQRYTMMIPNNDPYPELSNFGERQNVRLRENASHIFKELSHQVKNLERDNKHSIQANQNAFEKITRGRQKLETIQSSQSQAVLAETVTMLFKKGQHINNFVNLLQSTQLQNRQSQPQSYSKLKQIFDQENGQKVQKAKIKLIQLLKAFAVDKQNKRKEQMVSYEVQVTLTQTQTDEAAKKRRQRTRRTHVDQVKKLKMQIFALQQQNKTLKSYMKQKNQQFENKRTQIIAQKIMLEAKLASSDCKAFTQKSKNSIEPKKEFIIEEDLCQSISKMSEVQSHVSIQQFGGLNSSDTFTRNPLKHSKVKISKSTKTKVKFQHQQQKILPSKLSMNTCLINVAIKPQLILPCVEEHFLKDTKINNMTQILQQPFELESQVHIESICRQSMDDPQPILKVTQPKITISQKNSFQESNCPDVRDSSIKSKNLLYNQFSQFFINQAKQNYENQALKRMLHKKGGKKESILKMIQDTDNKRKSNFSQPNFFRTQNSREYIRGLQIQLESHQQFKRSSRLNLLERQDSAKLLNNSKSSLLVFTFDHKQLTLPLVFDQSDLKTIFIEEQNAKTFELLNLSLVAKNKKFLSALGSTSMPKAPKLSKKPAKNLNNQAFMTQKSQYNEMTNQLIGVFFQVLTYLKRDKLNYRKICSFLRYPYSSVFLVNSPAWQSYQQQESNIDYIQLRKLILRLSKFHTECKSTLLCPHWTCLLTKLSVSFT